MSNLLIINMSFILWLLLASIFVTTGELVNKHKIVLGENGEHKTPIIHNRAHIDTNNELMNVTIVSKHNYPFSVTFYNRGGGSQNFKGVDATYSGDISYIEIKNIAEQDNKIKIYYNTINDDDDFDLLVAGLTFVTFLSYVVTGSNSKYTKLLFCLIFGLEIYRCYTTDKLVAVGEKLRKNILKIK